MLYHYLASDKTGKVVEADYDADNLSQILQYLSGKDLRPISVTPVKEKKTSIAKIFSRINLTDKVFLTKYLALMLKVGTDLLSAINILIADFDKPAMKNFLLEVRDNLSHGQPFYIAFAKYPRVFSLVFVNLVKAAEASGNLQETFESISEDLNRDAELRNRTRSALIYPIIILAMSLSILIFLVTFALPKIADVFIQGGINPPPFSRIVFGVGLFIAHNITTLFIVLTFGTVGSVYFFWKNRIGRRIFQNILNRLPIIKKIRRDLAIQRFASTMSSLMKAGLPIIQTIEITAETVGSEEFRTSLRRIGNEGLAKGLTIGEAFRREKVFPQVVTNLVAISEKAGHLEEVLDALANFYAGSIDASIKSLVSLLEPALLVIMGIIVAMIAFSIIMPIYQLTSQF